MLLFVSAVFVLLLVVVVNPLLLWLQASFIKKDKGVVSEEVKPLNVSMVTVLRTPDIELLEAKITNVMRIAGLSQWVLYHDGPASLVLKDYMSQQHPEVRLRESTLRKGKNAVLNEAIECCSGEVVLFSDADSLQQADCLDVLQGHFDDASVGGVCGQRVIAERHQQDAGQSLYIDLDSHIKAWESRLGQLTSNDGKLYAVRRPLLQLIPDGVTDDLYSGLTVLKQKQKFVFDRAFTAEIRLPSRSLVHEVQRRRRIVCRSLRGLWLQRRIFRCHEYGLLSIRLFINKVLRRLIPHSLLVALVAMNALLFSYSPDYLLLLAAQVSYLCLLYYFTKAVWAERLPKKVYRLLHANAYVLAGLYGTLLGSFDFLRGEQYVTWTPKKS